MKRVLVARFIGRGRKREGRKREGVELGQPAIEAAVMAAVTDRGRRGGEGVMAALMAALKAGSGGDGAERAWHIGGRRRVAQEREAAGGWG